jgi:hypothetical protein
MYFMNNPSAQMTLIVGPGNEKIFPKGLNVSGCLAYPP